MENEGSNDNHGSPGNSDQEGEDNEVTLQEKNPRKRKKSGTEGKGKGKRQRQKKAKTMIIARS